jgi:hypothetical protein
LYLGGTVTLSQAENPEFEISLSSDAGFRDLLELEPDGDTLEPTQIFVRMKAGFAVDHIRERYPSLLMKQMRRLLPVRAMYLLPLHGSSSANTSKVTPTTKPWKSSILKMRRWT